MEKIKRVPTPDSTKSKKKILYEKKLKASSTFGAVIKIRVFELRFLQHNSKPIPTSKLRFNLLTQHLNVP